MSSKAIAEKMGTLFSDDPTLLKAYECNTLGVHKKIDGVLFPTTTDDVVAIVQMANELKIKLYPISTGKNWGYGDTCPVTDNSIIVDLSRLNKILQFDAELGVVILEPGVTVQQLSDFLRECGANFICPINNSGPRTSVVGNILEKGISISGPTIEMLRGIEAILPNGEIYKSPLWTTDDHNTVLGYRWGVGPYLDGLFPQASLGIVTKMIVALPPLTKFGTLFSFNITQWDELEKAITSAHSVNRKMGKNFYFSLHLSNHVLSIKQIKKTFLDNDMINLHTKLLLTSWCMTSDKHLHDTFKKIICDTYRANGIRLKTFALREGIFWEKLFNRFSWCKKLLPKLAWRCAFTKAATKLFNGAASEDRLISLYKNAGLAVHQSLHPGRDGLGIIWFTTTVIANAKFIESFYELAQRVCPEFNFDPTIVMYSANATALVGIIPLIFDLNSPEQVLAADKCYQALFEEGKKTGFYPTRIPASQMQRVIDREQVFWKSVRSIKNTLDPNNIISSERYS